MISISIFSNKPSCSSADDSPFAIASAKSSNPRSDSSPIDADNAPSFLTWACVSLSSMPVFLRVLWNLANVLIDMASPVAASFSIPFSNEPKAFSTCADVSAASFMAWPTWPTALNTLLAASAIILNLSAPIPIWSNHLPLALLLLLTASVFFLTESCKPLRDFLAEFTAFDALSTPSILRVFFMIADLFAT